MRGTVSHSMKQPGQFTIRGASAGTLRVIRELARRERISLNKAAVRILDQGAGVGPPREVAEADQLGSALDPLIGTWTEREARSFEDSIAICDQIDAGLWK